VASLANQATNWLVGGVIPKRIGSDHPNIVPYGTMFTTKDNRHIVLAIGSDKQFARLCAILGAPELVDDPRFATNPARVRERDSLCAILRERIMEWDQEELLQALHARAVPAGAVNNMKEVCEQPAVSSMLLEGTTSHGTRLQAIRTVAFDSGGVRSRAELSPPPHYGEHTYAVLRDMLQYGDEAIQTLHERMCVYVPGEGTATGTG
jgi:crotonobetainyl-CoA:carnitine CoA-transferase CaiB-like acyl-CoA transferase